MKTAIVGAGDSAPSPGRSPGGANGMQSRAVSSIQPVELGGRKLAQVATNDRKTNQQTKTAIRGHIFKSKATAAASPAHASVAIMTVLAFNQNKLGARSTCLNCSRNELLEVDKIGAQGIHAGGTDQRPALVDNTRKDKIKNDGDGAQRDPPRPNISCRAAQRGELLESPPGISEQPRTDCFRLAPPAPACTSFEPAVVGNGSTFSSLARPPSVFSPGSCLRRFLTRG